MNKKCPACGLVNFATVNVCRRCGGVIPDQFQPSYTSSPLSSATLSPQIGLSGVIGDQIRRTNRNLMAANVCIILVTIAALAIFQRYFYNFLVGPFPLDPESLTATTDPDSRKEYFVSIPGEVAVDTGMKLVSRKSGSVKAKYLAVAVSQEKLLLVKVDSDFISAAWLNGELVTMPFTERNEIVHKLELEEPEIRGAFLPIMLDATGFKGRGYLALGIGVPLVLLAVWNVKKLIARNSNPTSHPIVQSLESFGHVETVAARIDQELKMSGVQSLSAVSVTPSWLIIPRPFSLAIVPLKEVVWVYKKVTRHYYNFIPVGKSYAVIVCDRNMKSIEISLRRGGEMESDRIIRDVTISAPWAFAGFDDEIRDLWRTNASRVIQAVDERRRETEREGAMV